MCGLHLHLEKQHCWCVALSPSVRECAAICHDGALSWRVLCHVWRVTLRHTGGQTLAATPVLSVSHLSPSQWPVPPHLWTHHHGPWISRPPTPCVSSFRALKIYLKKCKFYLYIFGHYVTCHIYLEFCKTDISSFHLKILISISPVNLNIIKPVIEKNNNGTVVEQNNNDIDESHEKMNLVDAFEEDYYDGEDREDRQLFFQRFRPRPLRLNPAAAALIPAIPTFVGGLHLIKTMIQMRKVDPRPGHSLVTTMEVASWCKINNNSPPKRPEQFLHHPIN